MGQYMRSRSLPIHWYGRDSLGTWRRSSNAGPSIMPGRVARVRRSVVTRRLLAVCLSTLLPLTAAAFDFKPTPAEFAVWPEYCQARYAVSIPGKASPYASMVSPAMVQMWRTRLGPQTFEALHHHCAGLIHMQRARLAPDEQHRVYEYRSAEQESGFTLKAIPPTSPLYRQVLGNVQMARAMLGAYGSPPR